MQFNELGGSRSAGRVSVDGSAMTERAGEIIYNELVKQGADFTEDLDTTNTGALYVTMLRDAVREVPRPPQIAQQLLFENRDMIGTRGTGAIKLPKNVLRRGAKLTEGNKLTYQTEGYDSITVTPTPFGMASRLTLDLLTYAGANTILREAKFMRQGVELATEYEFINTMLANATSDSNANGNDNQVETGSSGTAADYADFRAAEALIETYNGTPTDLVVSPNMWRTEFLNDTDIKTALRYSRDNRDGTILPHVAFIGNVQVHVSSYCPILSAFMVDRENFGSLVLGSELEVGDVMVADTFDKAVGAYQFFGFGAENEDMVVEIVKA